MVSICGHSEEKARELFPGMSRCCWTEHMLARVRVEIEKCYYCMCFVQGQKFSNVKIEFLGQLQYEGNGTNFIVCRWQSVKLSGGKNRMCGEIREILMLTYVDLQFFNVTTNNSVLFTVQCHLNCKVFGWICFTTVYNVKIEKYMGL